MPNKVTSLQPFLIFLFIDKNLLSENENIDVLSINTNRTSNKPDDPFRDSTILEISDMNDREEKKHNDKDSVKDKSLCDMILVNEKKNLQEILIDRNILQEDNLQPFRHKLSSLDINSTFMKHS